MIGKKQRTTDFRNLMWKAFKPEWRVHTMNGRKFCAKPHEEHDEILGQYAVDAMTRNFKCTNSPSSLRRGIIAPVALKHAMMKYQNMLEKANAKVKETGSAEPLLELPPLNCVTRQYTREYIEQFDKYLYRRMVAWKKVRHKPDTVLTKEQRALKKIWKRYGWQNETTEEWFVRACDDVFCSGVRLPKSRIAEKLRRELREEGVPND